MKYSELQKKQGDYINGIALPLSAIKSSTNSGCGEFADLKEAAGWCRHTGFGLIQLLPLNDTGTNSSPYSALSGFALNPLYLNAGELIEEYRLQDKFSVKLNKLRKESDLRFSYTDQYAFKTEILKFIYTEHISGKTDQGELKKELEQFQKTNPWIYSYGVYKELQTENENRAWWDWSTVQGNGKDLQIFIREFCSSHEKEFTYHLWSQYLLHKQLSAASSECEKMGVMLKGDIPILMNRDSADVWAHQEIFDLNFTAGAPPDMFSLAGQNWGFPVYQWEVLKKSGYRWWKDRLKWAEKYFHAYRIDHVLGFFRIWSIPAGQYSGDLGYYEPSVKIKTEDLNSIGFTAERITWLSCPHLPEEELRNETDEKDFELIAGKVLRRINNEPLFLFQEEYKNEAAIYSLDISPESKEGLIRLLKNNTLIKTDDDGFFPYWHYRNTRAYHSLNEDEKNRLNQLIHNTGRQSEEIWEKQGRELLTMMKATTDMLVCAEDLGAIPSCVPMVLDELKILSLKMIRWAREYSKEGAPFIRLKDYPYYSVATSSVHDSSTLRGYWDEVPAEEKEMFLKNLGLNIKLASQDYSAETAARLITEMYEAQSMILIFPVQDILWMINTKRQDDRINVPGTVNDTNWTYKMELDFTELQNNQEKLGSFLDSRNKKRSWKKKN